MEDKIIELHKSGYSMSAIANKLKVCLEVVHRVIIRYFRESGKGEE